MGRLPMVRPAAEPPAGEAQPELIPFATALRLRKKRKRVVEVHSAAQREVFSQAWKRARSSAAEGVGWSADAPNGCTCIHPQGHVLSSDTFGLPPTNAASSCIIMSMAMHPMPIGSAIMSVWGL